MGISTKRPLATRAELDKRITDYQEEFAARDPELPNYWGGYLLRPLSIKFWHSEYARLHQRRVFRCKASNGKWESALLYPQGIPKGSSQLYVLPNSLMEL